MKSKLIEAINHIVSKFKNNTIKDEYDEEIDENWRPVASEIEVEDDDYFVVDEDWAVHHISEVNESEVKDE